jgi:hypothetical protein
MLSIVLSRHSPYEPGFAGWTPVWIQTSSHLAFLTRRFLAVPSQDNAHTNTSRREIQAIDARLHNLYVLSLLAASALRTKAFRAAISRLGGSVPRRGFASARMISACRCAGKVP